MRQYVMANTYVYNAYGQWYINLTNKCSNSCDFCIRNNREGMEGQPLWLEKEPTADEVIAQLPENLSDCKEITFCGFGEPTYKLGVMLEVAKYLKNKGVQTRLNTNGQSDEINGRPTACEMKGLIDKINVSLNSDSAVDYDAICHSIYGERAFQIMLDFAHSAAQQGIYTIFSVVDVIGEEKIENCRKIAEQYGVHFRVRKFE